MTRESSEARESREPLTRWGAILGIVVALLAIAAALRAMDDDRYVTRVEWGQMQGDIRVIRSAVCRKDPEACRQ